ncbi:helix-turn-helix domain-containing protein [Paraglaciecola chathamensis]|uniref:Helix-turn-helix domain-containing protein n=1 Tax=Paraglaciecola chathamensis TaxID=368405 RepID=A0ABS0WFZ0_9ALTE|nr:helix-turn-helix domain-containing protein [Paraglaciecola chathamensis]MBJ2137390.1 helix-turn-helix domain-containing protein [Paraglaciecola chathamensis]
MLKHVTLFASENAMGLSLGLTHDVLAFASTLQKRLLGQPIDISLVTVDGEPTTTFSGLAITPDCALEAVQVTDLIILHSIWGEVDTLLTQQAALYPRLRAWHKQGKPIMAAATGAYFLAEAGLLDDRIATTHWHKQADFAKRYPKVNIRPERFITATGEIYCSAGMNAAMESMVYLISRLSCPQVGEAVEHAFLVDFRSGYSGEFTSMGHQTYHQDDDILAIQQWLEIHFMAPISIETLAGKANMSTRTFKRRFKEATGETPLGYIQQLRVEQGKELLKHSDKSVEEISWLVGYQDAGHFNRLFKRSYRKNASSWRQHYRQH